MNIIRKTIVFVSVVGLIFLAVGIICPSQKTFATAVDDACAQQPDSSFCKTYKTQTDTENPITKTIGKAVTLFAIIAGAVAVIWIMYGGFKFITSDGDSGRIEEARKTILYGVVGLVVLLSAQVLVTLILNAVTK
jgi:hypothetical protein